MEADLQRFYGIDYRDRWRRRLPLRRLWVLVTNLPPESATATALRGGKPWWSLTDHLVDDLRIALTTSKKHKAKPHPSRPKPGRRMKLDPGRLAAGRRRRAERARAIAAGEIT